MTLPEDAMGYLSRNDVTVFRLGQVFLRPIRIQVEELRV